MLSQTYHRYIFFFGTALLLIGMPVSFFILSLAQIVLFINWLFEGNFRYKFNVIKTRKALLLIFSIYLVHVLGLFNTDNFFKTLFELRTLFIGSGIKEIIANFKEVDLPENFCWALHDLRIKLPLLILPLVYGTSEPFSKKEFKAVMQVFIATVLANTFITTFVLLGFSKNINPVDTRYASLFISHIRFGLLVVLSVFSLVYLTYSNQFKLFKVEKIISSILIIWFLCFLILLKSFTGILIFLILFPVGSIWIAFYQKNRSLLKKVYITNIVFITVAMLFIFLSFLRYNHKERINPEELKARTANGRLYYHNTESDHYENGFLVWINICDEELKNEWNQRSRFRFDSVDRKNQRVKITLIRYLTSRGYTKDSLGISKLDDKDIAMIENGYTNYLYRNKFALYPKIYELFWQIELYRKGANPGGHSLTQRIEFLKTGIHIIQNNFWFGTGTGDVKEEYRLQYIKDDSKLNEKYRLRAHNQLFTFFLSFGPFGFLWISFALFYSPKLESKYSNFLFTIFFLIGILSMLNEDTLETHVGVSFFAFFYAFLLFSMPENDSNKHEA